MQAVVLYGCTMLLNLQFEHRWMSYLCLSLSSLSFTCNAYCTNKQGQAWRFQEHPFVLVIFLVCLTKLHSLLALGQNKIRFLSRFSAKDLTLGCAIATVPAFASISSHKHMHLHV